MYNNALLKQTFGVTIEGDGYDTILISDSEGFGGPRGLTWRGEYDPDREYGYSDLVLFDNKLWIATDVVKGVEPDTGTAWELALYGPSDEELNRVVQDLSGLVEQAEDARDTALAAQVAASNHEDGALSARNAAEDARDTAFTYSGYAATSANSASISAENSAQSASEAEEAKGLAEAARDAAVVARSAAESARDAAVLAKTDSESARDASVLAKSGAESARDAAVAAKTAAEGARDAAQLAKTGAESARSTAESARDAAQAAETKAEKWAEHPEDSAVEAGKYSARHWAAKADASANAAASSAALLRDEYGVQIYAEDGPLTPGLYPATMFVSRAATLTDLAVHVQGDGAATFRILVNDVAVTPETTVTELSPVVDSVSISVSPGDTIVFYLIDCQPRLFVAHLSGPVA